MCLKVLHQIFFIIWDVSLEAICIWNVETTLNLRKRFLLNNEIDLRSTLTGRHVAPVMVGLMSVGGWITFESFHNFKHLFKKWHAGVGTWVAATQLTTKNKGYILRPRSWSVWKWRRKQGEEECGPLLRQLPLRCPWARHSTCNFSCESTRRPTVHRLVSTLM